LAAEERPQGHALALVHLALAFLPPMAHHECTQWPSQGRELSFALLGLLVSPIMPSGWVVAGQASAGRLRVAVVTACAGLHDGTARVLSEQNRRLYTALHGYSLHFFKSAADIVAGWTPSSRTNITRGDAPGFWRALAVQRVLESPERYDWVLWLDCEAMLTDPARAVPSVLEASGVPAEGGQVSMLLAASGLGAQAEAWLIRDSPWSRAFLRRWTSRVPELPAAALGEQAALRHALLPHWEAWLRGTTIENWDSVTWPAEVRLAPPGTLLSPELPEPAYLPPALARAWQEGDFAWHDASCRRSGGGPRGADAAERVELCRRRFELAQSVFTRRMPSDFVGFGTAPIR